jgi:hypothetical protein
MEHDIWLLFPDDAIDPGGVPDVGHDGGKDTGSRTVPQLALNQKEGMLAVAQQDQPFRAGVKDLPAQLGANRSARAGDQHAAAPERRVRAQ